MENKNWIIIGFIDGTQMKFEFLVHNVDYSFLVDLANRTAESNKLILEAEGVLHIFPYANIKYIKVSPSPEILPDITLRVGLLPD